MKRLATRFGLVLLLACFWALPASAICYNCRYGGMTCNQQGWCTSLYTCNQISGFCDACWEDCYEDHFGGYCHSTTSCLWTGTLPGQSSPDLDTAARPSPPATAS